VNAFEAAAVQTLLDKAAALGVEVPARSRATFERCQTGVTGGHLWVAAHPGCEDGTACCCWGAVLNDEWGCTCWVAEYDIEQAPPRPPTGPGWAGAAEAMCDDCAFRKGSPERAEAYTEETLLGLAEAGKPFWCHTGMRRPARWRHPDGRVIDGSTDDWQPPIDGAGIPYRADGSPGLLCAGWAARAGRAAVTRADPSA
jgi:hypothetical protein